MEGTIKKLIRDRGFGFILGQNGQDVFFHRSSLEQLNFDSLREGLNVEFELFARGEELVELVLAEHRAKRRLRKPARGLA